MNTTSPFAQTRPELTLKRRPNIQAPLESDNTLAFEGDLSGAYGQAALQAAWDKLYRARSILEAEQAHMRDDRIAFQGEIDALDHRERTIAMRELRMQQIEHQAQVAMADAQEAQQAQDAKEPESTISRLTRAPFDMARSVFGKKD
jgi:hypothetical protein